MTCQNIALASWKTHVGDGRIFAGIWNYLCIATWGAGTDDFAADLIIDAVTQALSGTVVITGSMYCDVAVRMAGALQLYRSERCPLANQAFSHEKIWTSAFASSSAPNAIVLTPVCQDAVSCIVRLCVRGQENAGPAFTYIYHQEHATVSLLTGEPGSQ